MTAISTRIPARSSCAENRCAYRPKAFALLAVLIERRPKAVSKQELHKLLWPDTFVSDANLPNLVAELREAFGDDAHEPRLIRTVQRFGYAFSAETSAEPRTALSPATG